MVRDVFFELNKSLLENFYIDPKLFDISIFSKNIINEYFNYSIIISRTFLIIGIIVCAISLLFSFEIFSTSKIKKSIIDIAFAIFILETSKYFLNWAIEGSNLFLSLWFKSNQGDSIIDKILFGTGVDDAILPLLNTGFHFLLFSALIILFLYYVLNSLITLLLGIGIILFPFFISLYPISIFKKISQNFSIFMLTLFLIVPLQGLCITITASLFFTNIFSINSLASLFGLLIMIVFVIPGLAIRGFNRVFIISSK